MQIQVQITFILYLLSARFRVKYTLTRICGARWKDWEVTGFGGTRDTKDTRNRAHFCEDPQRSSSLHPWRLFRIRSQSIQSHLTLFGVNHVYAKVLAVRNTCMSLISRKFFQSA